jgi:hypothetical protein
MKSKGQKPVIIPNRELVEVACEQFDREGGITEDVLTELFGQYPTNTDHPMSS